MPDVELINLDTRRVYMSDGAELPITDFFDGDGEDCEPYEAVVCVAGSDAYGWVEVTISPPSEAITLH